MRLRSRPAVLGVMVALALVSIACRAPRGAPAERAQAAVSSPRTVAQPSTSTSQAPPAPVEPLTQANTPHGRLDAATVEAAQAPDLHGHRLVVGTPDGLFEIAWHGERLRRLGPGPVRAAVRDGKTLLYVTGPVLTAGSVPTLRRWDPATGEDRELVRIPSGSRCKGKATAWPLDDSGDWNLVPVGKAAACVQSVALVGKQYVEIVANLDIQAGETSSVASWCWAQGSEAPRKTFCPARKGHLQRPHAPAGPHRFVQGRVVKLAGQVSEVVADVPNLMYPQSSRGYSPFGRWELLEGALMDGEDPMPHWCLLDSVTGALHPVALEGDEAPEDVDPCAPSLGALGTRLAPDWIAGTELLQAQEDEESDPERAKLGECVFVPGVGGYCPGGEVFAF